ncbi:MAG: ATP-binding protein [Chloroflexota bacterium]
MLDPVTFQYREAFLIGFHDVTELKESQVSAQRRERDVDTLAEIGRIVSSSLALEEVYERFAELVRRLIPGGKVAINTVDRQSWTFTERHVSGWSPPLRRIGSTESLSGSMTEWVVENRRGILAQSDLLAGDMRQKFPRAQLVFDSGIRSFLAVPLIFRGEIIGTMHVHSTRPTAFELRHLGIAESIGAQVAGAIAASHEYRGTGHGPKEERHRFLSTASRELAYPLTEVMAGLEHISEDDAVPAELQAERLSQMRRSANRLALLTKELVDLSALEDGSVELDTAVFDARDMLEETADDFRSVLSGHRLSLETTPPGEALETHGDRARLSQAIASLLGNAARFSPPGTEIRCVACVENGDLIVEVADEGPGLREAELERVFEPFYRGQAALDIRSPGMGVGLAIARQIAELHGGSLDAANGAGGGAVFRLCVPQGG